MNFEYTVPTSIVFGYGSIKKVPQILSRKGRNILLVTGKNKARAESLIHDLSQESVQVTSFTVEKEPSVGQITEGTALARKTGCQVIAAIGGGSVIDCGKAIAALTPNAGDPIDYLEVIGKGKTLEKHPLPFIAIPTTAGTGAEATKNAVIHSPGHQVKVSLRSPLMFPDIAVIDPALTHTLPPEMTAASGMDALTHLLETFVSIQANPHVDLLCREGLTRISRSLRKAFEDGADAGAREDMSYAALLGGMALANVRLGAVHGFAGPLGGMFPAPHGAVCASLLPAVMEVNLTALKREQQTHLLKKYKEAACILTQNQSAREEEGVEWAKNMVRDLHIPSLSAYGISPSDFPALIEKARNASSMKGNPVLLNDSELQEILERSL